MNARSIAHDCADVQQSSVLKDQVFCPMCEIWHENNSWCQAPAYLFETGGMDMEVVL